VLAEVCVSVWESQRTGPQHLALPCPLLDPGWLLVLVQASVSPLCERVGLEHPQILSAPNTTANCASPPGPLPLEGLNSYCEVLTLPP
jgi:hypothetical protein